MLPMGGVLVVFVGVLYMAVGGPQQGAKQGEGETLPSLQAARPKRAAQD